ncbi:ribosome maturation factor RimP [Rhodocaloribacter sp.]
MTESMKIAATPEERVRTLVEEVIDASMFVVEVIVRGRKGSRVVEVFLDGDEPLSIEALARVSREVGFLLDVEEVIDGKYRLNVSSPGLDRPLTLPRQYKKHVGRTLRVRFRDGENERTVKGKLLETAEDGIVIAAGKEALRIPFTEMVQAKVELPW